MGKVHPQIAPGARLQAASPSEREWINDWAVDFRTMKRHECRAPAH
jgi:hypothetical protein